MKRIIIAALLCGCSKHPDGRIRFPVIIPEQRIAIIPAANARSVLRQCSRETPDTSAATWTPTDADIEGLAEALPPKLHAELIKRFGPGSPMDVAMGGHPSIYGVQVVGIVQRGMQLVYVNGFLASTLQDYDDSTQWRRDAVVACDGGEFMIRVASNFRSCGSTADDTLCQTTVPPAQLWFVVGRRGDRKPAGRSALRVSVRPKPMRTSHVPLS